MTLAFVLALMSAVGAHDRDGYAAAIARVTSTARLPAGVSRPMAAALLVVYAWEEGRFQLHAPRGDGGRARCALQVHGGDEFEASALACVRAGWHVMRASYELCGDARGYCGDCLGTSTIGLAAARSAEAVRALRAAARSSITSQFDKKTVLPWRPPQKRHPARPEHDLADAGEYDEADPQCQHEHRRRVGVDVARGGHDRPSRSEASTRCSSSTSNIPLSGATYRRRYSSSQQKWQCIPSGPQCQRSPWFGGSLTHGSWQMQQRTSRGSVTWWAPFESTAPRRRSVTGPALLRSCRAARWPPVRA